MSSSNEINELAHQGVKVRGAIPAQPFSIQRRVSIDLLSESR